MSYKRFSRVSWTFSIPKFRQFFKESDFFNSQACLRQLTSDAKFALVERQYRMVFLIYESEPFTCNSVIG